MGKIKTVSKYFFKKNLKDIISFSVILLIATVLFSSAVVVGKNVDKDYDKQHEELNTAEAFFTIPKNEYLEMLIRDIKNIKGVNEVDAQNGVMLSVPVKMDGSVQEQVQIFYNKDIVPIINKRKIILEEEKKMGGIYLSNYTFGHSGLKLGDNYEFKINDNIYSFAILGVVNEMQYGNYASSVIGQYLENDAYNYLLELNREQEIVTISVKAQDSKMAYNEVSKYLTSRNINILNKNEKENAKNGRMMTTKIIVLILMVFAGIMLIISLVVSKFKIEQTIQEEMANMGVLKALGYTSREIIGISILPYILCGVICSILGIIFSYFLLPVLGKIIEMQAGFIWKWQIDKLANIFVLIINILLIVLFTLVASLKIRKLNPINSIRGLTEKSNGKNYFEVEKTALNIHFILMLKNFINTKKQNLLLGMVLFLIMVVVSFLGILFYNVNMNPINFINTLVEEHPSVIVTAEKDIRQNLRSESKVKNVLYYDESVTLNYKGNSYKTLVAENFLGLANDLCYEGNNPRSDDEVAIGSKIAEEYEINIGDDIILSKEGQERKYRVVGFIQSVNYFGEVLEMTLEGYKKLDLEYLPKSIYVYLEDENRAEEFITYITEKYKGDIISTMNYGESMDSAMQMFIPLISIICIVVIGITLLLIYLILYILLNGIIMRRKQELGIFKAIGYENKQLIRQLVGGFIPSVIIAILLGLLISKLFMNNIYSMIFKEVGVYKVALEYPTFIFVILGVFLIISTLVIGNMLARKIKKISVYALIKD